MAHSEEVLINYFRDVIRYQGSLPPQKKKMVESSRGLNSVGQFYEQLLLVLLALSCSVEYLTTPMQH